MAEHDVIRRHVRVLGTTSDIVRGVSASGALFLRVVVSDSWISSHSVLREDSTQNRLRATLKTKPNGKLTLLAKKPQTVKHSCSMLYLVDLLELSCASSPMDFPPEPTLGSPTDVVRLKISAA